MVLGPELGDFKVYLAWHGTSLDWTVYDIRALN